ncbi:MAG: OmpA family protein [Candidatus Kapabacteria bacterium]|nr:OmpA family protein [Candidatus Kapabacteria bacterium]
MRFFRFLLIFTIVLITSINLSIAKKDSLYISLGIYGNYNLNYDAANFPKLPGIPNCCEVFKHGYGNGYSAGLIIEVPLAAFFDINSLYYAYIKAGYSDKTSELLSTQPLIAWSPAENKKVVGEFEHHLADTIRAMSYQFYSGFKVWNELKIHAGISFDFLTIRKFHQFEKLSKPEGGTFYDSTIGNTYKTIRNDTSGVIPQSNSLLLSGIIGLSYDLPLDSRGVLVASPEIFYHYGLNNIVQGIEWKKNIISLGVSVKYSLKPGLPKPPLPPEPIKEVPNEEPIVDKKIDNVNIDTLTINKIGNNKNIISLGKEKSSIDSILNGKLRTITKNYSRTDTLFSYRKAKLAADISAKLLDEADKEITPQKIKVEEFETTNINPLLTYIFFDEASSEIPQRYHSISKEKIKSFSEDELFNSGTLDIYYNLLNIVGLRMRNNPKVKITLTGIQLAIGAEQGLKDLARQRAESVRNYLTQKWEISEDRIKVNTSLIPENESSNYQNPDKLAEIRHVEIKSANWDIVKPVTSVNKYHKFTAKKIRFYPETQSEIGTKSWEIQTNQGQNPFQDFKGDGESPKSYDYNFTENDGNMFSNDSNLTYAFKTIDNSDQAVQTPFKSLAVEYITTTRREEIEKTEIKREKFNLILFDFDKSEITPNNKRIIDFIKSKIKPNSFVKINGFADRVGEPEHNLKLSEQRAQATANALKLKPQEINGIGSSQLLYDNNYPEGRFYCRTVEINIETKLDK